MTAANELRAAAATAQKPLVYRPPAGVKPGGRVDGGTRGGGEVQPSLFALAPDHAAPLTGSEQPTLYCFVSKKTTTPIEFTLVLPDQTKPILEVALPGGFQPGINKIPLAKYGAKLIADVEYTWSVALVYDATNRARDIVASGSIKRINLDPAFTKKAADAKGLDRPWVYAEARLWYDTLDALWRLIEVNPSDNALRRQFEGLLVQIGLTEVKLEP